MGSFHISNRNVNHVKRYVSGLSCYNPNSKNISDEIFFRHKKLERIAHKFVRIPIHYQRPKELNATIVSGGNAFLKNVNFWRRCESATMRLFNCFTPTDLVHILNGFAKGSYFSPMLFDKIGQVLADSVDYIKIDHFHPILLAYSTANIYIPNLFKAIERRIMREYSVISPNCLSLYLTTCDLFGYRLNKDTLDLILPHLDTFYGSFPPEDYCRAIYGIIGYVEACPGYFESLQEKLIPSIPKLPLWLIVAFCRKLSSLPASMISENLVGRVNEYVLAKTPLIAPSQIPFLIKSVYYLNKCNGADLTLTLKSMLNCIVRYYGEIDCCGLLVAHVIAKASGIENHYLSQLVNTLNGEFWTGNSSTGEDLTSGAAINEKDLTREKATNVKDLTREKATNVKKATNERKATNVKEKATNDKSENAIGAWRKSSGRYKLVEFLGGLEQEPEICLLVCRYISDEMLPRAPADLGYLIQLALIFKKNNFIEGLDKIGKLVLKFDVKGLNQVEYLILAEITSLDLLPVFHPNVYVQAIIMYNDSTSYASWLEMALSKGISAIDAEIMPAMLHSLVSSPTVEMYNKEVDMALEYLSSPEIMGKISLLGLEVLVKVVYHRKTPKKIVCSVFDMISANPDIDTYRVAITCLQAAIYLDVVKNPIITWLIKNCTLAREHLPLVLKLLIKCNIRYEDATYDLTPISNAIDIALELDNDMIRIDKLKQLAKKLNIPESKPMPETIGD